MNAVRKAGEVFHDGGGGKQSARLGTGEDEWGEIGARSVDGGSEAGATGAKDDGVAGFVVGVFTGA